MAQQQQAPPSVDNGLRAEDYPYASGRERGVSFGEGHSLAVPSWVLFLGLFALLAALGYVIWAILNMQKSRQKAKDDRKAAKHQKKAKRAGGGGGGGGRSDSERSE